MTPEQEKRAKPVVVVAGGAFIAFGIWHSISAWQNQPRPMPPPSGDAPPAAAPTQTTEIAPSPPPPAPPPAPTVASVPAQPAPPPPPPERDPFFPVQSPPRPPQTSLPPPPVEGGLFLTAICMATDRPAYAVINGSVVSEGEQTPGDSGYLLKDIRENGVLLLKDGKEYYLTLK